MERLSRAGLWRRRTAPFSPELQRFVAKLMGATSYEAENSHAPMLSNSALLIHVIRTAAESIAKSN